MDNKRNGRKDFVKLEKRLTTTLLFIATVVLFICAFFMGTFLEDDGKPVPWYLFTFRFLGYPVQDVDIFDTVSSHFLHNGADYARLVAGILCIIFVITHVVVTITTTVIVALRYRKAIKTGAEVNLASPVTLCYVTHVFAAVVSFNYTFTLTSYLKIGYLPAFPPVALFGIIFAGVLILTAAVLKRLASGEKISVRFILSASDIVCTVVSLCVACGACITHYPLSGDPVRQYSVFAAPIGVVSSHVFSVELAAAYSAIGTYVVGLVLWGIVLCFIFNSLFAGNKVKRLRLLVLSAVNAAVAILSLALVCVFAARFSTVAIAHALIVNVVFALVVLAVAIYNYVSSARREADLEINEEVLTYDV